MDKSAIRIPELSDEQKMEELKRQEAAEIAEQERKKKSPYKGNWSQYNLQHTKEMMWLALKHPGARAILDFLVEQMDTQNAVMCSYKVMQEVLGVSSDTVRRSIKVLKEKGFIAVFKSGTSNVYAVNDNLYWKSYGKNIWQSKFPANVVLSLSEQDRDTQQKIMQDKLKSISISEKGA